MEISMLNMFFVDSTKNHNYKEIEFYLATTNILNKDDN